ncbi:MAG: peptidylprolyl isomerase [Candidatus Marinimicrobia bacterium]|nr:peptidylprolyl isomerase [Candidatus Neomarinimicrobiota bacterium]
MKIIDQAVVSIHYTLTDKEGTVLDSSEGEKPMTYLHGAGGIIPGLERELIGKTIGDKLHVTVQPEDGYGLVKPELLQTMPLSAFEGIDDLKEGMQLQAEDEDGNGTMILVRKIDGNEVTIDGNHPLAGQVLVFDVTVEAIRKASHDELDHGHAH